MSQGQLQTAGALVGEMQRCGFSREDAAVVIETYGPDMVPIVASLVRHGLTPVEIKMIVDKFGAPLLKLVSDALPFVKLFGAGSNLEGGALDGLITGILPGLLAKYLPQILERIMPQLIQKASEWLIALLGNIGKVPTNAPLQVTTE